MRVYLAGPDVFLPEPATRAATLKAICARHGLLGVSPLDALEAEPEGWAGLPESRRIALRNEAHMVGCGALIANLTPFRGRPVFGWSNAGEPFAERTRAFLGISGPRDAEGMLIEAFGLTDNLMIDGAILASGGTLFVQALPPNERWTDLRAFERCVLAVARRFVSDARMSCG